MKTRISLFFILSCITLFSACRNTDDSSIPDVPVYLNLNLSINYNTFKAPLQYEYFTEKDEASGVYNTGYAGVLVNINMDSRYCAFDMCCPHEKQKDVRVYPDKSGGWATCEKCGSQFDLVYGYGQVSKGPAKEGLKRYKANPWNNAGIQMLRVTQ